MITTTEKKEEVQTQAEKDQQYEVTEELLKDLSELIVDPKFEVKKGTLNILMRCLQTEQQREKFVNHPIFLKQLMQYSTQQDLDCAALTCMIQLSSDTIFHEQMHDIKIGDRLVNNIKDKMEEIIEKEFKMTKRDVLFMELSILILVNFTQSVQGKNSFLSLEREDEQQGINIMILMKIFSNEKTSFLMKYFPNILVNISSYETGRKLLVQPENEFLEHCFKYILSKDRNMRTGIQRSMRNVVFEYENEEFIEKLFSKEIDFINQICLCILIVVNSSCFLHFKGQDQPGEKPEKINLVLQDKLQKFGIDSTTVFVNDKDLQTDIGELWSLIDCILILTNVDIEKQKPHYNSSLLGETIAILQYIKLQSELTDKLEVINSVFK